MEETLVIYDNNGKIYSKLTGVFDTPIGLQHIVIVIPEKKILVGVNPETHEPIFEDVPPTETEMQQQALSEATMLIATQQQQIDDANNAISELTMLMAGGME